MRLRGAPLTAVALALGLAAGPSRAHAASAVSLGPGSVLWLSGKSTMHDYESRSTDLTFTLVADPGARPPADPASLETLIRSSRVHGVEVLVPVRSLHSKKGGLDKNLWRSLNADQHPNIRFRLSHYTLAPSTGDTLTVHAEGLLEVSGQERPEKLVARAYRSGKGVWLEGSEPLRMSDFGIRPPRMMMGTLRVADEIIVRYRLLLVPGDEANARTPVSAKDGDRR